MKRSIKDLSPSDENPRTITDHRRELLAQQLKEFGDLGGVVWNVRSRKLVAGHQRTGEFDRRSASIEIVKSHKSPTKVGTVAEGFIVVDGERFAYREVDWTDDKARLAMLAANNSAGQWDDAKLQTVLREIDAMELELTGFEAADVDDLLAPPPGPTTLRKLAVKPPPKMAWALIGIPIDEFGKVQGLIEKLPDSAMVKTSISDEDRQS